MTKPDIRGVLGTSAWILAALGVPAGAFLLYVNGQLEQVEARNLRNLAKAADAIERLVANAERSVASLLGNTGFACEFVERQTRLELVQPADCGGILAPESRRGGSRDVALSATGEGLFLTAHTGPEAGGPAGSPGAIRFRVRFDRLLSEIPFGRDLDLLLVANRQGHVMSQQAGAGEAAGASGPLPGQFAQVRVVNLGRLDRPGAEAAPLDLDRVFDSTSVTRVTLAGVGYQLLCQPLVLPGLVDEQAPASDEGEAGAGDAGRWVLCGLADKGRGFREALALAPHLVIVLVAVVLLVLFTWPILKLLTMSQRERLRFHDVFFLLVGSLGALMFATVLLVAHDTHATLREQSRASLEKLAHRVESNLTTELGKMYRQLRTYDDALVCAQASCDGGAPRHGCADRASDGDVCLSPSLQDLTDVLAQAEDADGEDGGGADASGEEKPAPPWSRPHNYRFFGSAFWMRPCDGQQLVKLTVRRANTPRVKVRSRDYFQAVQTGELWCREGCADIADGDGFYLQAFRSLTTGEFAAALSLRSRLTPSDLRTLKDGDFDYGELLDKNPSCAGEPVIAAALSGKPVSTTRPVLGPGISFAIIAADGSVIFHSDERRATFENLYEEVADADRLAAAVSSRSDRHLDTAYSATPHQLFVHPFDSLPWFVVTMADSQILRTNQLEVLMRGGFYLLLYLGVFFLLSGLYVLIRGRTTPRCLWPFLSTRASDYAWGSWMLTVVALAFALALQALDDATLLWASIVAPLAPVLVLGASAWLVGRSDGSRWCRTLAFAGGTVAAAAGLWLYARIDETKPVSEALVATAAILGLIWPAGAAVWLHRALTGKTMAARFPQATDAWRARVGSWRRAPGLLRAEAETDRRRVLFRLDRCLTGLMVTAFLSWLIVAVLPAFGIARYAVEDQTKVLVRYENVRTLLELRARNEDIAAYYRGTDSPGEFLDDRRSLARRDVYWSTMFWDERRQRTPSDVDDWTCPTGEETNDAGADGDARPSWLGRAIAWIETPEEWLDYLPIYNETAREMRYLAQDDLGVGSWVAATADGVLGGAPGGTEGADADAANADAANGTATGDADGTGTNHGGTRVGGDWRDRGVYFCPAIVGLKEPEWLRSQLPVAVAQVGWRTLLGTAAILALLVLWVRYGARRLFFGDISVRRDEAVFEAARDESRVEPIAGYGRFLGARARRDWLEHTELEPWDRTDRRFDDGLRETMLDYLDDGPTRAEAITRLVGLAADEYQRAWEACSDDERLVLVQIAREGVVNPKQQTAVRNLLGRGLLVRDPALRIVNRSFALFALQRHAPRELAELERGDAGFGWAQMRWILLIALFAIVAFLWTTQPAVVENILKYLSAAAVGAGALMKIVSATDRLAGRESKE